jgi:hypothetical protein
MRKEKASVCSGRDDVERVRLSSLVAAGEIDAIEKVAALEPAFQ